jgi:hypothetical protein
MAWTLLGNFSTVVSHMSENAVLVLEIGHEKRYFNQAFPELEPCGWHQRRDGAGVVMDRESTGFAK